MNDEKTEEVTPILTEEEIATEEILRKANFDIDYHTKELKSAKIRLKVIEAGIKATANPLK